MNTVKWVGTVLTIISAIVISLSPHLATKPFSFTGYLLGAICWLYYAWKSKDYPLACLNAFYIIINGFGIYARL